MAKFEGTFQEFHHYIGPKIRNAVNVLTKKEREGRNRVCEDCCEGGKTLEAAHIHGRGRRDLIEEVLARYLQDGIVRCDLKTTEQEILELHYPLADSFKFICKPCHTRYDTKRNASPKKENGIEKPAVEKGEKFLSFYPDDERAFKALLLERKVAYGALYKEDGTVEHVVWSAERLRESSNLRGNIFSGYLRNWKEKGIIRAEFSLEQSGVQSSAARL
jgi:hypothetical protein